MFMVFTPPTTKTLFVITRFMRVITVSSFWIPQTNREMTMVLAKKIMTFKLNRIGCAKKNKHSNYTNRKGVKNLEQNE